MPLKVLIFGGTGMLGHCLAEYLGLLGMEVVATSRKPEKSYRHGLLAHVREVYFDASSTNAGKRVAHLIDDLRPDWVINCVGMIKQKHVTGHELQMIELNACFPRMVFESIQKDDSIRFLTISTDCVFDGARGGYHETDRPNARDLYGLSKILGEIDTEKNALTIRTSIFGPELELGRSGLFSWFMNSDGEVQGFTDAIFSGVTTLELSKRIAEIIVANNGLYGLYHLSADPVSKYELLALINKIWDKKIELVPNSELKIDRSLSYAKLTDETGYKPANVFEQLTELKDWCDRRDYGYPA